MAGEYREVVGVTGVVYVPGGPEMNLYIPWEDTIILDESLRDYPLAHERVRRHEMMHAKTEGVLSDVLLEFREDLFFHFSTSPAAVEARQYFRENRAAGRMNFWEYVSTVLVNGLRLFWDPVMYTLGLLYRRWSS